LGGPGLEERGQGKKNGIKKNYCNPTKKKAQRGSEHRRVQSLKGEAVKRIRKEASNAKKRKVVLFKREEAPGERGGNPHNLGETKT